MKLCFCFISVYYLLTILLFWHTTGLMSDYYFITIKRTRNIQQQSCKDLGYAGLAVADTPEKWTYLLRHTEWATEVQNADVFIGLEYNSDFGAALWEDGSPLRSDLPIHPNSFEPSVTNPYARLYKTRTIKYGDGIFPKYALCGYEPSSTKESWGSIVPGGLNTATRSVLSETRAIYSYPECALMCGMTLECRAAEFNSDFFTCTLIGVYTSAGSATANPNVMTYVREIFPTS